MSRQGPAPGDKRNANNDNTVHSNITDVNFQLVNLRNSSRTDTGSYKMKANSKQKSELDAINMQNGLGSIQMNSLKDSTPTIPGEDNQEDMEGDSSIDDKPSKKVSALISQFNNIVHSGVTTQPRSSSFRAASTVTKTGPSGNEINVTRSQSLSCKMSIVTSGNRSENLPRGKETMLQPTSEKTQCSTVDVSGRNGIKNVMKNSRVVSLDIKMPDPLVDAVIKTSDKDNRTSGQSSNDQFLTWSAIRNAKPVLNVRMVNTLDTVSEKSNTLPNKKSNDNNTANSDTRVNVKVGSVWSTASIFDALAKSEQKSKLNSQNQIDKPAFKPRTNTAWSKLRSSLGHNFNASILSSQSETMQNKDFGMDLAVSTKKNNDAENGLKSECKDGAKITEISTDQLHVTKTVDKKSKMESNLSIRGLISPSVIINPEIPKYRKTSLKSIAQITNSMEHDVHKSKELNSPPQTYGNELQGTVSAANVISDLTTVKPSSELTQFKEHIPTVLGHAHKVAALEHSNNIASSIAEERKYKQSSIFNQNIPDDKVLAGDMSRDVRQCSENEVKNATKMAENITKLGEDHGHTKQQISKCVCTFDSKESQMKRQNSHCMQTESVSQALVFDVLDVQNTKVAYCNATDRINNALNKLKTELMSMRQMDLLLLKQLINISQTIQTIQKSRVLRVSKSLSFSSSYLHPKPLQSQRRFHSTTLERQNSAPFTMDRKRLMFRDMRSSTESSLSSFDESEFDSQSEMDESTTSLTSIYPYLSPKAIRARTMSQSRVSEVSLFRDMTEDPDKTYEDILKRNVRLWKLGVERQTSVIEEVTCLL